MIPLKDDIPSNSFPYITNSLILVNLLVFVLQLALGVKARGIVAAFGVTPYEITHLKDIHPTVPFPVFLTIFTSMFLHGGLFHVLGNMLYLWIFGDNVEDALGSFRFLCFYLLCGTIALATHIFIYPDSLIPLVGASGAISGVLGAYLLLYPNARVLTLIYFFYFIKIVKIPAVILLTFWIFIQFLSGTISITGEVGRGGVAWFAHIGGFFAGMALLYFFRKKNACKKIGTKEH